MLDLHLSSGVSAAATMAAGLVLGSNLIMFCGWVLFAVFAGTGVAYLWSIFE